MTPNAVRLVLTIALLPLLPGLFFLAYAFLHDFGLVANYELSIFVAYALCAALAVSASLLLWRSTVTWTPRCIGLTVLLAVVLMVSPATVFYASRFQSGYPIEMLALFCYTSPLFAWALWLAGTARLWRTANAARESAVEPVCAQCGYSLRGLREVRCPECGWTATVDGIVQQTLAALVRTP